MRAAALVQDLRAGLFPGLVACVYTRAPTAKSLQQLAEVALDVRGAVAIEGEQLEEQRIDHVTLLVTSVKP